MTRLSAIREGTRRDAQRAVNQGIPASGYRALGRTGLLASSVGFGCYRIDDRTRAVLTNTKGFTGVLNGMRHPNYVDDSLGALHSPTFDVDLRLYDAFNYL